jgi:hypothetical protein
MGQVRGKLYRYLAEAWKNSSIQMNALSDVAGIKYYHFLQPNQYVKDSKPMTEQERKIAIYDQQMARLGVLGKIYSSLVLILPISQ